MFDQTTQTLDGVATPLFRGPAWCELAARMDERHVASVAGIHQHDVVRMSFAPPPRRVQVETRKEIGIGVFGQQHHGALIKL